MVEKPYAKSPAFFRAIHLPILFEPEELNTDAVVESLHVDNDLDAELDAILAE